MTFTFDVEEERKTRVPEDALNMFFGCDLEYLMMEDVLVRKRVSANNNLQSPDRSTL